MAGVDLRTIQVLGGWRTLAMVQRYAHLAPAHLRDAVERLVPIATGPAGVLDASGTCSRPAPEASSRTSAVKHERNLNGSGRAVIDVS